MILTSLNFGMKNILENIKLGRTSKGGPRSPFEFQWEPGTSEEYNKSNVVQATFSLSTN